MDYQKTGNLISSLRKEKGLTQKELADKLGITDRAVSKWERGLGCPDISLLDDLSRILDISILEILKGRRLDKDEIVNNESIIETMNYSKENLKYKFKKYVNSISIIVIIVMSLMLIFFNLKSIYYLNKTYYNVSYDDSNEHVFVELEDNLEIVRNNQGIYSDEDYKVILEYINELEENLKYQNNLYYYSKNNYTYSEIFEFYNSRNEGIYFNNLIEQIQRALIHNYEYDEVDNIISYYTHSELLIKFMNTLYDQIKAPYYNNEMVTDEIVTIIKNFVYDEAYRDNMMLKDIIEVGDINE